MVRSARASSIKALAGQRAEDFVWGIPESPEFSLVHRLINEFKTQESEEERWLVTYKKIAEDSGDPIFRFLLNLIIADEERHHLLIGRMISSLNDDLASPRTIVPPPGTVSSRTTGRELAVMVERFLEVERTGIRECEKLKKISQRFRQDLLALLCETMVYDSLKHIGILNFLRRKLRKEQGRGALKKAPRSR